MAVHIKVFDNATACLIPLLILVHLIVAPHTKVEESFNIQATHDVLVYGMPTTDIGRKLASSYDHFSFPGAVPRTFLGPVLLGGLSQPIVALFGFNHSQIIVRGILGLFNAFCLLEFAKSIRRTCGDGVARWYLLLQVSQFHVMFYASRTLPNMFAFGLTTLAFARILPNGNVRETLPRQRVAVSMFVFAGVIFRSEVALLLVTNVLYLVILPAMSLERMIKPALVAFVVALLISVPVDSYFWQRPLWPELWGFYYNAILGSSSNWGVSPWHYYFTSALPRLLLNPLTTICLFFSLYHPALSAAAKRLAIPSLLFVAIYSLQPHKEARFIFYVVPPLTAAASLAANQIWNRRSKSIPSSLLALALVSSVIASFATSTAMLLLSSLNYPGGEGLSYLRNIIQSDTSSSPVVSVHADVLACMTGVTLFGTAIGNALPNQRSAEPKFVEQQRGGRAAGVSLLLDKTENAATLAQGEFWTAFDYLLMEDASKATGGKWETVAVVLGYGGVEVSKGKAGNDSGNQEMDGFVVGKGKLVRDLKRVVTRATGGWWVGPRMVPKIHIMKRRKESQRMTVSAES